MPLNRNVWIAKRADRLAHDAQQGIVVWHYDVFADRKLDRFEADDQVVPLFVDFGLILSKHRLNFVEVLLKAPLCRQPLFRFLFLQGNYFMLAPGFLALTFKNTDLLALRSDLRLQLGQTFVVRCHIGSFWL